MFLKVSNFVTFSLGLYHVLFGGVLCKRGSLTNLADYLVAFSTRDLVFEFKGRRIHKTLHLVRLSLVTLSRLGTFRRKITDDFVDLSLVVLSETNCFTS